jgi:spore maturation protein CgeB
MRILFAGDYQYEIYEQSCVRALEKVGHEVISFAWKKYFATGIIGRAQYHYLYGPAIWKLNRDLMNMSKQVKPDMILIWQGQPVWPETLKEIKKNTGAFLVCITNDNPFSKSARSVLWRHAINSIPLFDCHFVYRYLNIEQFRAAGAKRVHLLRAYFVPELHFPVPLIEEAKVKFSCDVVFVGHYEPDGRAENLMALAEAGFHVKIWGTRWNESKHDGFRKKFGDVTPVLGQDYAKALTSAKTALCFLSKLNEDTYTRRCFEIPACGTILVSERTDDLKSIFKEDEEAIFFSSKKELVDSVRSVLNDPKRGAIIASAGRERVLRDGHDVFSRMNQMIRVIETDCRS